MGNPPNPILSIYIYNSYINLVSEILLRDSAYVPKNVKSIYTTEESYRKVKKINHQMNIGIQNNVYSLWATLMIIYIPTYCPVFATLFI